MSQKMFNFNQMASQSTVNMKIQFKNVLYILYKCILCKHLHFTHLLQMPVQENRQYPTPYMQYYSYQNDYSQVIFICFAFP
jgi:hypothetical protein